MIMSVRNILNHSQLSVFQEAQIFLNSVKMQRYKNIQMIKTLFPLKRMTESCIEHFKKP